jgi:hypothetical protein
VRDLLSHHRDIQAGMVVSPTEPCCAFYAPLVPPTVRIHHEYSPRVVADFLAAHSESPQPAFVVFDNCMWDRAWLRDKHMRRLITGMPGMPETLRVFTQSYASWSPRLRERIDYVFILRETVRVNRMRIFDQFASAAFATYDIFSSVLDKTTADHECLVIDIKAGDKPFWYKAQVPAPYSKDVLMPVNAAVVQEDDGAPGSTM